MALVFSWGRPPIRSDEDAVLGAHGTIRRVRDAESNSSSGSCASGCAWVVRVGELLGDDALEVGGDYDLVERAPFADDAVGEHDPALGLFGDLGKSGLAVAERQGPEIHAVGKQQVEGDVCRTVIPEQEFVEQGAVGVIEDHQLAIET